MIRFASVASNDELTAVDRALRTTGALTGDDAVEALGWQAVGSVHDEVQSSLGFRQGRQLASAYKTDHLAGSRRWLVHNISDYPARFAAAAERAAVAQQSLVGQIMGRLQANRSADPAGPSALES